MAQLERQYLVDRQAYLTVALQNQVKDLDLPMWEERQATLDSWLAGEDQDAEPDILRELGVAA